MTTGLRTQLQTLYDQHGELSPDLVVSAASPKEHPLHAYFEWDNKVAGPKYRLLQAEDLIRSIKVTYKDRHGASQSVRWWHPVRTDTPSVYDPLDVISENEISMSVLLRQAERDWKLMKRRYGHLTEFWQLVKESVA